MYSLKVKTAKKDQVIDITSLIEDKVPEGEGVCSIFVHHTTCCLTISDLDPGTDLDLLDALRKIVPHLNYRHPHDPNHVPDHIISAIIGPSITIPYSDKKLSLGTWQSVILIELDGPRERNLSFSFIPS